MKFKRKKMSNVIKKINEEKNVFGDDIAFVYHYDFSQANNSDETRIEAITTVASICYDNPNVIGKENLYNRLKAEAMGLPSSSFEFVPVLISRNRFDDIILLAMEKYSAGEGGDVEYFTLNIEKYGQWIVEDDVQYLLTNYRALLADHETLKNTYKYVDITQIFNELNDAKIIKKHSTTFLYKMDLSTSKQHNRHRASLQELSRRYVSGKKTEFEFYTSDDMKDFKSIAKYQEEDISFGTNDIRDICINHYFEALANKVKPQSARRILPQSMYTTIWTSFLPFQLDNYLALRDDLHAQDEIRWLAQAMKRLLGIK